MIYYGYNVLPHHLILQEKSMRDLRCFTAYWNYNRGELRFDFPYQFQLEHIKKNDSTSMEDRVLVLDALKDAIFELTELYEQAVDVTPFEILDDHYGVALGNAIKA